MNTITRLDYNSIVFHGEILDGYNGHTVNVVAVDAGTNIIFYHSKGSYSWPKTPNWFLALPLEV